MTNQSQPQKKSTARIPVKQWALYRRLDDKKAWEYSLLKLGDTHVTTKFIEEMCRLVCSKTHHIPDGRFALFAIDRYPRKNPYCKKTSLMLAEGLAKHIKIPLIVAWYRYINKGGKMTQSTPKIQYGRRYLNRFTDVLSIDDSIYSGTSLNRSLKVIGGSVHSITHYAVLRGRNKSSEIPLNNLVFKKKGLAYLPTIIKKPGYFLQVRCLKQLNLYQVVKKNSY